MNYFWRKNLPSILIGALIAIVPLGVTVYQMNAYDYSPLDVKTTAQTTVVTLNTAGDATFVESKTRDMIYHVSEQFVYFTADDEDVSYTVHTPQWDATAFSASAVDASGTTVLSAPNTDSVWQNGNYFAYADQNISSTIETGAGYYVADAESAQWMFYNPDTWGNGTTFHQTYKVKGAAVQYDDTAEFFWTVAYTDYIKTSGVDVTVVLPTTGIALSDVTAYIFGSNNAKITRIYKNDSNHIAIEIKAAQLYPNEFITTRIDFPREALTIADNTYGQIVPQNEQLYPNNPHLYNVTQIFEAYNQGQRRNYGLANLIAVIIGAVMLLVILFSVISIYTKYDKEPKSDFYNEYFRELPADYGPAMMGYLYDFKEVSKNSVTATLMDLVRRKFVTIDTGTESLTERKVNYTLVYDRTKDQSELKQHERYLLKWFFDVVAKGGNTLTLNQLEGFCSVSEANSLRYQECNRTWVTLTTNSGENQGFFDNVKEAARKGGPVIALCWIIGIAGLVLGFMNVGLWTRYVGGIILGLAIVLTQYFTTIQRRSLRGNEEFVRWKAFKKFLTEFSNIKDYPMPGIIVWEHYMVYAIEFGIADLVEAQMRFKYKELGLETEINNGSYLRYRGFYSLYNYHYMNSMAVARTVVAQAQAARAEAQRNNSARGGGGMFGGGGGFGGHIGGGGGGGHFR